MRISKRIVFIYIFSIASSIAIFFAALKLGDTNITNIDIFKTLIGESDGFYKTILIDIRMPRILMALLIGMLLAQTGLITQNVFSNPIADPFIIGIASAATFGAILGFLFQLDDSLYGILGFVACSIFSIIIFKISRYTTITTLLIVGIAISAFLGAFTSFAMYYIGEQSFKIVAWLMGYIGLASWYKVGMLSIVFVLTSVYFFAKRNELNILLCGDEEAKTMGVDSKKLKNRLLILSSLAVSFSVSFTGIIGFVGLIIPHITRMLTKNYNNAIILPISTIIGGAFLLFCDTLSRTLLAPIEIPVGIVTSFFGAPFFIYLALRRGGNI